MMCSRLTRPHSDAADVLLSKEVPDLHQCSSLLNDHVDGEMGVHRAHFVPETLQSETSVRRSELNWWRKRNTLFYNNKGGISLHSHTREITARKSANPTIKAGQRAAFHWASLIQQRWQVLPAWRPWSCSGRGCKWCGPWPAPSCFPTIYPHEAKEDSNYSDYHKTVQVSKVSFWSKITCK